LLAAVLSDTHDHISNLRHAVELAAERGAVLLVHCGDLVAPFMIQELAAFLGPVHLVFGNNDGDLLLLSRVAAQFPNITLHGQLGDIELEARRIAFAHTPELARPLAASGLYGAVFFGHTHAAEVEWVGDCLLLNPGDLMGKDAPPSFALYDSAANRAEQVVFEHVYGP
jgi:putative phosphoesterase